MSSPDERPDASKTSASGDLYDRHTIETPEQVELHFDIAGVGSRFLALLVDTLIQTAAVALLGILFAVLGATGLLRNWRAGLQWLLAGAIALVFLLNFGYFSAFEIFWKGQTPGKRKVGLRVMKDSGRPLTAAESLARNLLRIVDQVPGFYALGFICAMTNRRAKRIGDFVAGSIVVHDRRPAYSVWSESTAGPADAPQPAMLLLAGVRLSDAELMWIDAFLVRRRSLPDDIRYRMARELVTKLAPKLREGVAERPGVETVLEVLAREGRT